jgi:hypothetical protein
MLTIRDTILKIFKNMIWQFLLRICDDKLEHRIIYVANTFLGVLLIYVA